MRFRQERTLATLAALALAGCSHGGESSGAGGKGSTSTTTTTTTTTSTTGQGGSGPLDHGVFQSGTRLRARYFTDTQGAEAFWGIHDSMLGVDCVAQKTKDGSYRCLPIGAFTGYYEDAACTKVLAEQQSSDPNVAAPTYAIATVTTAQGTPACHATDTSVSISEVGGANYVKAVAVGSKVSLATVYVNYGGACQMTAVTPTYSYYEIGADIPDTTFQSGTVATEMIGPRAKVNVFHGDDGSYFRSSSFVDSVLGYDCPTNTAGDRCLGRGYAVANGRSGGLPTAFSDQSCMIPVGIQRISTSPACSPPDYIVRKAPLNGCMTAADTYFQVGSMVPSANVWGSEGTLCETWAMISGGAKDRQFFALGPQLADDHFLLVGEVGQGKGRLSATSIGLQTGERVTPGIRYRDSMFPGESCYPARFVDGKIRCVPDYSAQKLVGGFYMDAACTKPISEQFVDPCRANKTVPYVVVPAMPDAEPLGTGILPKIAEIHVATPYTGQAYQLVAGACNATTLTSFSTVGATVDPGVFPEVQLVQE